MVAQTALALVNPTSLFDYAALDRTVEVEARSDAALIKGLMRRTADDLIEIGKRLNIQKEALKGAFPSWIAFEFEMSQAAAYRFMTIAEHYDGGDFSRVRTLSGRALYELATPTTPDEVRTEVERRVYVASTG
jgi:hypothetical protein